MPFAIVCLCVLVSVEEDAYVVCAVKDACDICGANWHTLLDARLGMARRSLSTCTWKILRCISSLEETDHIAVCFAQVYPQVHVLGNSWFTFCSLEYRHWRVWTQKCCNLYRSSHWNNLVDTIVNADFVTYVYISMFAQTKSDFLYNFEL